MADEFIYYPYTAPSNTPIVDQSTLKHHYFAQLSPDKRRLIPGMLQQSTRPAIGQWIDVGNVTRTFSKRYFVEYTDFNTLVPGSLIQARTLPTGKWKEVKMAEPPSNPNFHRVVFTSGYTVDDYGIVVEVIPFINNKVRPVLAALFPDLDVTTIMGNMFYFLGNYEQLIQDTSQMEPFGEAAFIKVYSPYFGENWYYIQQYGLRRADPRKH